MIEIEGLSRRFGKRLAVDGVSFAVARGEVVAFLGPNGAGKTTTMRMIAGFLAPSAGRVRVCGHDVERAGRAARRCLGFLPEGAPLYPEMTARGLLRFGGRMHGLDGPGLRDAVARAGGLARLDAVMDQRIETLSKGFRRRVALAMALLHDPPVLVLDEPTDGLDPNQKQDVRDLVRRLASEKAILLATHMLDEVEAVCSRAVVIARGRIVADAAPAFLAAEAGGLDRAFRALTA